MISEIREQIERELSRVFPRFRKKKLSLLALEIVWVSVQLRTATLIDSFLLSSDEANILGDALQRVDTNITVAHEPYSGQTLVVNRKILSSRTPQDTVFIEVGGRYPQIVRQLCYTLSTPPEPFRELLSQVTAASPSATFVSLSLPDPDRPQDLIPLVGHLLDYKIAYTLGASSEGGANCLGGTELFLVEASVQIEQGEPTPPSILRPSVEFYRKTCGVG
ncbi:hypothetical protein JCM16303_001916 [Sporobolomyces ruberrimus]